MIAELISWLVAFIVLAVVEAFTFQLVSIWFALGSVVAFVAALCGAPLWLQITLFVTASLILLAAAAAVFYFFHCQAVFQTLSPTVWCSPKSTT